MAAGNAFADDYATDGTGKLYTLESLSEISESGVTKDGKVYTMANNVTITAGDSFSIEPGATIKMGDAVEFRINGTADMLSTASEPVTVTRNLETDAPKGITLNSDTGVTSFSYFNFEYASLRNLSGTGLDLSDCTFRYANGKLASTGALTLGMSGACFTVSHCTFEYNEVPAIGGSVLADCGLIIDGCTFIDNNTANTNKPQVNITAGGENSIIISNSTFTGAQRDMVGGLAIANWTNLAGSNTVLIDNNTFENHRYGVTLYGFVDATLLENKIINNSYASSAMAGGAGVSIYDYGTKPKVVMTGNTISGNLWGVTVIGGESVNFGKTDDPNAADYNEGHNVFSNNGNGGVLYDLYNNSTVTVYAQGNKWGVDEQTAEKIETVIYHKYDNSALGEVIYTPAWDGEGSVAKIANDDIATYLNGVVKAEGAVINVYTTSGKLVATAHDEANLLTLARGIYVVKATSAQGSTVLKCIR